MLLLGAFVGGCGLQCSVVRPLVPSRLRVWASKQDPVAVLACACRHDGIKSGTGKFATVIEKYMGHNGW